MQKMALRAAGLIFLAVSAAHALRLAGRAEIIACGCPVPIWISAPAAIVTLALAVWMFAASRR